MKAKRKYRKKLKVIPVERTDLRQVADEIKSLIDALTTEYSKVLLSTREDLVRARARIKERQDDEKSPSLS